MRLNVRPRSETSLAFEQLMIVKRKRLRVRLSASTIPVEPHEDCLKNFHASHLSFPLVFFET